MHTNAMKKKINKPRNHVFLDLMDSKYDMRVVPNKKKKQKNQPTDEFNDKYWKYSKNWRQEFEI